MREIVIIGTGWVPIGAYPERGEHELIAPAIKAALDDAGLAKKHIDGVVIVDRT